MPKAYSSQVYSFKFKAMGSPCEIRLYSDSKKSADKTISAAVEEVQRLEKKYSRFLKNNFMYKLNAVAQQGGGFDIDPETYQLFVLADQCWQQSEGLFDITSGVLRKIWKFDKNILPDEASIQAVLESVGWNNVELSKHAIKFLKPNMELDFGGIVKEYAVDRAAMICRQHGVLSGMVDLGGDVFILGPQPDGQAWKIFVQHPRNKEEFIASFEVFQGGLASSGDYERFIEIEGQRYCHIFSPKTGWPIKQGLASVSVQAEHCVLAGTIASIAMLKEDQAKAWLKDLGVEHVWMDAQQRLGGS